MLPADKYTTKSQNIILRTNDSNKTIKSKLSKKKKLAYFSYKTYKLPQPTQAFRTAVKCLSLNVALRKFDRRRLFIKVRTSIACYWKQHRLQ